LFYLPRLFVYHAESNDAGVRAQLQVMQRRLLVITDIGGSLAVVFGVWMLLLVPGYLQQGWLHAKLALVIGLIAYHAYLIRLKNEFAAGRQPHSARWLRLFNEVPALFLIAIVILVVVKPF
jgi:putative membrane protein